MNYESYSEEYFKKLKQKVLDKTEDICTAIEGQAKSFVPVLTSNLKNSISHEVIEDGNKIIGRVGSNVEYAARIEFGFMDKRDKLGRLFHQGAHPYLRPALEAQKENIMRILSND